MANKINNLATWMAKKPYTKASWFSAVAACVSACVSLFALFVLFQNHRALRQNEELLAIQSAGLSNAMEQVRIQQISGLHPKLECCYRGIDHDSKGTFAHQFAIRNIGGTDAEHISLWPRAVCVSSNQVYLMPMYRLGTCLAGRALLDESLHLSMQPGAVVQLPDKFLPQECILSAASERFSGDVLFQLQVEYQRLSPTFHAYRGVWTFVRLKGALEWVLLSKSEYPRLQALLRKLAQVEPENVVWAYAVSENGDWKGKWELSDAGSRQLLHFTTTPGDYWIEHDPLPTEYDTDGIAGESNKPSHNTVDSGAEASANGW